MAEQASAFARPEGLALAQRVRLRRGPVASPDRLRHSDLGRSRSVRNRSWPDTIEVEQRFRLLYERHSLRIHAYAVLRTADLAAAEDLVADVFLVAWRRVGEVPVGNELPWLFAVARRVLANSRRADVRRDQLLARLHRAARSEPVDDISSVLDARDAADMVRRALSRLRTAEMEILQLAAGTQLSHAHIAVVLDCTANAVAIRLHRARQRLAEELANELGNP